LNKLSKMEIRSRIRRTYNTMDKGKRTTYKQLPIYKRLHRKQKIEQHEKKVGVNAYARKALTAPVPILTSVMLLLSNTSFVNDTNINNV